MKDKKELRLYKLVKNLKSMINIVSRDILINLI